MNILCIGDIVGRPGRAAIERLLPGLKEEFHLDAVIANAENSAGGSGITPRVAGQLFHLGCDVLTTGDHIWDKAEIREFLNQQETLLRPANFPAGAPGKGWCLWEAAPGKKIGVINLLGRVFMRYNVNCPFREASALIEKLKKETPVIIVDMHAEATSEKIALGFFLDGKVSALVGTHTHVQTADEKILPKGTAYITDLGMTGPQDSVIGQNKEEIIQRFLSSLPHKFAVAMEGTELHGVLLDIDEATGSARRIVRLQRRLEETVV